MAGATPAGEARSPQLEAPWTHPAVCRGPDGAHLLWRLPEPRRCLSSAPLGGGLGERRWIVNAQVPPGYARLDPDVHLAELAADLGCQGPGVGLMTAVDVTRFTAADEDGVAVVATVGLGTVTWAADKDGAWSPWRAGTINIVAFLPVPLTDAALVNAAMTATEAKTQALTEAGVPGTGTASDALCVCCPATSIPYPEPFCGPRSRWGAPLARVVRRVVAAGIESGANDARS